MCHEVLTIYIKSPNRIMKNSVFFTEEIQLQMKGLSFSTIMLDIQENTVYLLILTIQALHWKRYLTNWNILQMMFSI